MKKVFISMIGKSSGKNKTESEIKNILNYKRPSFWVIIVTIIATIIAVGLLTYTKNQKPDLSFLNPDNLAKVLAIKGEGTVKIADNNQGGFYKLSTNTIAKWIYEVEWKEKKEISTYEISPTYVIQNIHSDNVISELRLYEEDPTLVMIVYDDSWRYYTINEGAYHEFEMQRMFSSYFEPFEIN